jgi:hypothetical protein
MKCAGYNLFYGLLDFESFTFCPSPRFITKHKNKFESSSIRSLDPSEDFTSIKKGL